MNNPALTVDLLGFDPELLNLTQSLEVETYDMITEERDIEAYDMIEEHDECLDYDDDFADAAFDACMGMECSNDWLDR